MLEFLRSIATVLALTCVSEGLRESMIFGQTEQVIFNTILVSIMRIVSIIVGSLITRWEDD